MVQLSEGWMLKLKRIEVLLAAVSFLLTFSNLASAKPVAMRFLDVSRSPLASAMGQAGVALGNAILREINPAQAIDCDGSLISFCQTSWFGDISIGSAELVTSSGKHGLGLKVTGLFTSPLKGYDDQGIYQGDFRFFDICAEATYARRYRGGFAFGVTGKTVYEKIDWDAASGLAFDLGMNLRPVLSLFGGHVGVGISARNLGAEIGYQNEKFDLPLSLQVGIAYERRWQREPLVLRTAIDYQSARTGETGLLCGLEVSYDRALSFRFGYMDAYQGRTTFGVGLHLGRFLIDYSYMPFEYDLGSAHRFGLGIVMGSIFPAPELGN